MATLTSYLKEIGERVGALREVILKKHLLKKYAQQFFADKGPDLEEYFQECTKMHKQIISGYPEVVQDHINNHGPLCSADCKCRDLDKELG